MNDQRLELVMGNLLRTGVLLAAGLVTIGGLFYLVRSFGEHVDFRHFEAAGPSTTTLPGIWHSATALSSEGLIQLGLLLLIATPVARVILAVVGFAMERDWLYVGVSAIVLAVLIASLMHAT